MSKEVLTHSETYIKKTNRIILAVGITSLIVFLIGIILLLNSNEQQNEYEDPVFTDNADALNIGAANPLDNNIVFNTVDDGEIPITTTPNPIPMGQVVLGTTAYNVLTIGTNGKAAVKIVSVQLAEPPADGFSFHDGCSNVDLNGERTCHITMEWTPVVAGNVQNNFIVTWYETNLGQGNSKAEKIPVIGNAINKEDCNFCENVQPSEKTETYKIVREAVGPDGSVIGSVDEDGYVRDKNGNIIGRVNDNGLVVDNEGNVIGVAGNRRLAYDENGNVIGYVLPDGTVVDKDGNIIGRMLPDGTIVDLNGNVIGKGVDAGYVYDKDGNIIGRVLPDGTVVDLNGNVIGRLNENGEVVDANGNVIGYITKPGRVAVDENGNPLGVVMPDGTVVDRNGNVIGRLDENGNVVTEDVIGKTGNAMRRLAYDKDGNVIGYIDENGNVVDFNGNIIGRVLPDGTIVDLDGNVIGRAGDAETLISDENSPSDGLMRRLAYDKDGNVIGYIDENGNVIDFNGNIIGKMLPDGTIVDLNGNVIGKAGDYVKLALDENGKVIGYITPDGRVIDANGEQGVVVNIGGPMKGQVTSAIRTVKLVNGTDLVVEDEITALPGLDCKLEWRMLSISQSTKEENRIVLTKGEKSRYLTTEIESGEPTGFKYMVWGTERPSSWKPRTWDPLIEDRTIVGWTMTVPKGQTVKIVTKLIK